MKRLMSIVMCCLSISGCGADYPYMAKMSESNVQMLTKTTSYNNIEIWCEKGIFVIDVGYGEYRSNISCTNAKVKVVYHKVIEDPNCFATRHTPCRYSYDGTVNISSNKTISTAVEIINSVLREKYNADSVK